MTKTSYYIKFQEHAHKISKIGGFDPTFRGKKVDGIPKMTSLLKKF
jgi:hypothetical protein